MKRLGWRWIFGMAAAATGILFVGCENGGGGNDGPSENSVQLYSGRLEIAAGVTAQTPIVTAPAAGVVTADLSVPEDHVSVTAWLEDADLPGSQYDKKTGAVLTLSVVTTSGKHWRTKVHNPNATLLHVNGTMRYEP